MNSRLALSTLMLAITAAFDAGAQTAAAPPAAAASTPAVSGFQRIIVTSQKRKEDVRQVPLAVSVIGGEALADNQVGNFDDLTRNVPNVSFSTQAGAGLGTIEIRGVSSQAGSATVSIYLDDVSLTTRNLYSQGTAEPRFFDIDRVEVLRGPQGTLYGASSLGGTIRFISRQPNLRDFGGTASAEVSSTEHGGTNYQLEGVVNVPVVKDRLALRVGVQTGHDSGYIDQVDPQTLKVISKGINSTHWDVVKLSAKAQLGQDWTLTPALFAQDYKSDDIDAAYLAVGSYQPYNAGTPLPMYQTSKIVREPGTDKLTVPSLTLDGDLGFADLTAILSGYQRRFQRIQDGTAVNSSYLGTQVTDPALGAIVGVLPSLVQLDNKVDQTSLELRLASKDYQPGGTPLTWIGGVFLSQTKTQVYDNEPIVGINAAFKAAGQDITDPNVIAGGFPGDFTGDSSYYSARHYDDKQTSAFGELTYHVSPALRAIAGLRVLSATEHFTREGDYYFAGGPSTALIDSSAHAVTPRFSLSWDLDPHNTVYANIAKGFRLGAANRPVPLTGAVLADLATLHLPATIPAAFKPDSLWSYEVGSKSRLWHNRLSLNASAFYIDWSDIQQDVVLPISGYDFETNVGKATSYGVELEAKLRATEGLTLNASYGWTHATFAEDQPALGFDANGNLNVHKGDPVQGVPTFSSRIGFDYDFAAFAGTDGFLRANAQWTGASHGNFVPGSPDYRRPSYFTVDASTGLTFAGWQATLFVKNLTNTRRAIQQPSIQSVTTAYYLRPRTIGLRASTDF
ncbi:MAG: TonB-dependent receptor [Burkholderiales bacterium]|nr:TonB-dependent receptor [Burkholderiales bacterium]MDE1928945.1 TonB-dependent receptor [Burkholderiales bacterium]MDE2159429.1 TonB-dependent receptor [Burkholderiales bacterium]MDE2501449.1 TonB-dependent receptor [Burkholderiales bacterium]